MIPKSIFEELLDDNPDFFKGEICTGVSETVPNQAVTAKDAMQRAMRNLPIYGVGQMDEMPFDGEQVHDANGVYQGENFDWSGDQPPVFSDEMDVVDFLEGFKSHVKSKVKKSPTPSKNQEPTPPKNQEPTPPKSPEPASPPIEP